MFAPPVKALKTKAASEAAQCMGTRNPFRPRWQAVRRAGECRRLSSGGADQIHDLARHQGRLAGVQGRRPGGDPGRAAELWRGPLTSFQAGPETTGEQRFGWTRYILRPQDPDLAVTPDSAIAFLLRQ